MSQTTRDGSGHGGDHLTQDLRGNRLLEALPQRERRRLIPLFEVEYWDLREVLVQPGQGLHTVYFPITAVMSVLALTGDEKAEVATVGNEGMVGALVVLGTRRLGDYELVRTQASGTVLRADASAFLDQARNGSALRGVVDQYLQYYLRQVSQQVACNLLHSAVERCARWILSTRDRVGRDEFPMTQQLLSEMLGVRRATVSVSARSLQTAGFVRFKRGRVMVLNRRGLEDWACECYEIIRTEFDRLSGHKAANGQGHQRATRRQA